MSSFPYCSKRSRPLFRLSDFDAEDYFFDGGLAADGDGMPHGRGVLAFHLDPEVDAREACMVGDCGFPIYR